MKTRALKPVKRVLASTALAIAAATPASALTFNYTFTAGTSAQAIAGFQAAGDLWAALLDDTVTVNLTVGTAALGGSIVGQASSRELSFAYPTVRSALVADANGASDATAVANLPATSVAMLINRTSDNPNGSGSATAFLDNNASANNTTIALTAANARALGLTVPIGGIGGLCNPCDAFIQFNSNFAFDFDRSNGITPGQIDFIGTAAHEIGHALGFISGVDVLDQNSPPATAAFTSNSFTDVTTLDLFRFSTASAAQNAIDWTASTTVKYFSLNRGLTVGPSFATGVQHGDGRQASHWKDNLDIGVMDPTVTVGAVMNISANDVMAMDVIGWDVAAIPEPPTIAFFAGGLLALAAWRRRRLFREAAAAGRTSLA
jgi:hypothetical protein